MGGDGTFLRAASMVGNKQIPILGVNTGRLGFLADVKAQEIEHTINALYEGDYTVDTRAVIKVETSGDRRTTTQGLLLCTERCGDIETG